MDHRLSQAHKKAAALTAVAQYNAIQNAVAVQLSEHYEATCVFRTVYNQAKLGRPFTNLQSNIDLQRLNGLNMGRILHSNVSSANITVHISNEMRKQFVLHIVENGSPIAVLVDESTTLSQKTTLIIYIRTTFREQIGSPVTTFFDLAELEQATANNIASALLQTLEIHGMSQNLLQDHLVAFASDAASVMLVVRFTMFGF